jgi:hypothetical protein
VLSHTLHLLNIVDVPPLNSCVVDREHEIPDFDLTAICGGKSRNDILTDTDAHTQTQTQTQTQT